MSLFERISDKIKDDLIIEMNKTGDDDPWDDKDTKTENKKKNTKNKGRSASTGGQTDYSNTSNQTGRFKQSKSAKDAEKIGRKETQTATAGIDPARDQFVRKDRIQQNQIFNPDTTPVGTKDTPVSTKKPKGRPRGSTNTSKNTNKNTNSYQQLSFDDIKKQRPPRKGVDYFFDAEKAKKERDAFQQGRKAYTDSKSGIKAGKVTKKGIIDYITKARNMSQGTNANAKANRKAAEIIAKSSGSEYAEKIRQKYETDKDLSRRRGKNQPSYAEVKKGIDARNPTYKSPIKTVGKDGVARNRPLPLSTRKIKKKIKTNTNTKPIKQFDGKSFEDFIKDAKKKSKKALQDVKNIKVEPVTKIGSKVSVGNQIPYVSPPPLKDPTKGLKFKKARAIVPKNKTLRAIQRAARKNPRLALGAAILGTIGTVAVGNRLRNPKSGIGAGGTGKKDPLVANVKATYFLDPKKTQFSVNTSKDPNKPNYRVLENPKFPK